MARTTLHEVASLQNLAEAWKKLRLKASGSKALVAGTDDISVAEFKENHSLYLKQIQSELKSKKYSFNNLLSFAIPKANGKFRIINIPTTKDRVTQSAVLNILSEKIKFKSKFNYGFLRNRTLRAARSEFCRQRNKKPYVAKVDIDSFFDSLPRADLAERIKGLVRQKSVHSLLLNAASCESSFRSITDRNIAQQMGVKSGLGVRQGMPLSPFFSNIYLDNFDVEMERAGYSMIRYADDFVIMCESESEARRAKDFAFKLLENNKLCYSEKKSGVYASAETVEFLGLDFEFNGESYVPVISDKKIRTALEKIECLHDIDFCLKRNIKLFKASSYMNNIIKGYLAAYAECENLQSFQDKLEKTKNKTLSKALESAFNIKLSSLSNKQKEFIGIEQ